MQMIIVIAPNVSEQMGGEAMKALQIYLELKKIAPSTLLITHERTKAELKGRLQLPDVSFVRDDSVSVFLWRSVVFRAWMDHWFGKAAVALANKMLDDSGVPRSKVIVFQVEPNSPVVPRTLASGCLNIFGPVNGNIYYPPMFRANEARGPRLRRLLHFPLQRLNRVSAGGIKHADLILTAGGERTRKSLLAAGCSDEILLESLDCGVNDDVLDRPRLTQAGPNPKFVHFGRLVFHKCTFLAIESLPKTRLAITLDVIGKGPELAALKDLTVRLGLDDRVNFIDPYPDQRRLFDSLSQYRGMVFPSIEDANGMVVQEAMAMGLPAICLDWGGPQLLVKHGQTGYLVDPVNKEHITSKIAEHMDTLAEDADLAESFSRAGRQLAESWRWSTLAAVWLEQFKRLPSLSAA